MMHARFYAPDARSTGEVIALPAEEVEHLSRVLRLKVGAAIQVFDGAGHEFQAIVESLTRSDARVRIGHPVAAAPELPVALTLAAAVLKVDKMDDVVRDATMMGVSVIEPVLSSRTEVTAAAVERGRRVERWQRIALASVKQCGRAVVPLVREPVSLSAWLAMRRQQSGLTLMLAEPGVASSSASLSRVAGTPPPAASVLIGPEGGWTPREVEAAGDVCQLVTLGGITLRADAAPTVVVAALLARWGVL